VECHLVEVIRALEAGECWHRDEVPVRHIEGLTVGRTAFKKKPLTMSGFRLGQTI
jgi:hypothetical protein